MKENRGRPSNTLPIKKKKYILEYEDVRYHYDLDYFPNPTTSINAVARSLKLKPGDEVLSTNRVKKIKNSETLYWREHYKCFPEDKPKIKKKRRKRNS